MSNKKKVLLVNEFSGLNTGYAVYGRNLFTELHKTGKYNLAELACYLDPRDPRGNQFPWRIYPAVPAPDSPLKAKYDADPTNSFGKLVFEKVVMDFKPEIILSLKDVWMDRFISESPFRKYYRWGYMPTVDGVPQDPEWLSIYKDADGLFTYSDWGKKVLQEYGLRVEGSASAAAESVFQPHPDKEKLKEELGFKGIKIIGMASRNQARKLFPDLMMCFRKFLNETKRNDVFLYLHTSNHDLGWDLAELIKETGLGSKIILSYVCKKCNFSFPSFYNDDNCKCKNCGGLTASPSNVQNGVSPEKLALIFNTFDLCVQYAISEGQGMTPIEAAACQCPVVEVDYSAMSDVARKLNGELIEPIGFTREITTKRLMAVPNNEALTQYFIDFFNLPSQIQKIKGYEARQGFLENYSSWAKPAATWMSWIDRVRPALPWNSPPNVRPIAPPQSCPPGLSNSDFVKWCILNMLGEPDKLHSFFHLKVLKDLNLGFSTSIPGTYMDEQSFMFKPSRIPFGHKEVMNVCANLANARNMWEQERSRVCHG